LVEAARAGQREAFEELYQRCYPAVARRLSHLVGPGSNLGDLIQETFVLAFRRLDQYGGRSPFEHWVLRIATNTARTFHRRKKRRRWRLWEKPGQVEAIPSPLESVDAVYPGLQAVHRALDRLSPRLREAVVLHELEGLSLAEMAQQLHVPLHTAASRVRRGRKRLRRLLEGMGYSPLKGPAVALYGQAP